MTYRLTTPSAAPRPPGGTVLYDVTRDGEPFLSGVSYREAQDAVLPLLADADRYQEEFGGAVECDMSGAAVREDEDRVCRRLEALAR